MSSERDNFKAGLFVIVGVVVALIFIWQLADIDQWYTKYQQVKIHYRLSDGVRGLKTGAQITLGDQPVGTVQSIDPVTENGRITGMMVTARLPERIQMYQDASVELVVPPLGSGTRLNIRSVGSGGAEYDPSGHIEGRLAGSALTASLVKDVGIEERQRQQIREIIANVNDITASLKTDLPEITAETKTLLEEMHPILAESRTALSTFREAADDVKQITTSVRKRSEVWMDRIDNITRVAQSALDTVDKLLADKDPTIRRTLDDLQVAIDNARAISTQVREQTMQQITDALDKTQRALETAQTTLDNVRSASEQLDQFATSQRPVIERAIANAQIAAGQLKLAAVEIRRSPWRLLYKPVEQQLETDNIYDAARSLVLAAEAVQSSTDSLRAVANRSDIDAASIEKMIADLRELLDSYSEAEDAFWEAIREYQPAASAEGG